MIRGLLVLLVIFVVYKAEILDFFQDDYDVKVNIAECLWYDKSFFRYFNAGFVLFNRTQRVFNNTFYLRKNLRGDLKLNVQVYKFMSNEYRFFPITVSINACAEYSSNTFNVKDILTVTSNMDLCHVKEGFYYIYNYIPDFSKFPPHMPRGLYKAVFNYTYYYTKLLTELDFYGEIKDKPTRYWSN